MVDLLLTLHDERQRRRLHPANRQHLSALLPIHQRVKPSAVHAQQPVAHSAAQSCQIETLILCLVLEIGKSFLDGLVGHGGNPKAFHGTFHLGQLHHPSLYQLTLLASITTVDDLIGLGIELGNGFKLLFYAPVGDELDAKALRNHWQGSQRPEAPVDQIVVGLLQLTQVTKRPGHLIAVAFHISIALSGGSKYARNVTSDARFLCDTNDHLFLFLCFIIQPHGLCNNKHEVLRRIVILATLTKCG